MTKTLDWKCSVTPPLQERLGPTPPHSYSSRTPVPQFGFLPKLTRVPNQLQDTYNKENKVLDVMGEYCSATTSSDPVVLGSASSTEVGSLCLPGVHRLEWGDASDVVTKQLDPSLQSKLKRQFPKHLESTLHKVLDLLRTTTITTGTLVQKTLLESTVTHVGRLGGSLPTDRTSHNRTSIRYWERERITFV